MTSLALPIVLHNCLLQSYTATRPQPLSRRCLQSTSLYTIDPLCDDGRSRLKPYPNFVFHDVLTKQTCGERYETANNTATIAESLFDFLRAQNPQTVLKTFSTLR